jgi:hypothetical protein
MLRQLFHSLSLRERFLLTVFLWALLLVWALSVIDVLSSRIHTLRQNNELLQSIRQTIELAPQADQLLAAARTGLDTNRTLTSAQLAGRLDSLARENAIAGFDISNPSTVETELFSFHTVRLAVQRASITELIRLDNAIKEHSPYIAMTDFQITANRRDPRVLSADFELVAFELKEEALND